MKNSTIRNQKGFTLIEIIAVLVILGILAAIAIPKYMDMQDRARDNAAAAALGAGASEVALKWANLTLAGPTPPTMAAVAAACQSPLGDYTFTYAASGTTGVTVTVTGPADKISATAANNTKVVTLN